MKKLTVILTVIGAVVAVAGVCAAVFFYLRKRAEKAADETVEEEAPAAPEAEASVAQTA